MWLADMHYRVAARQQAGAWEALAAIMGRLFCDLREIELRRKAVLKELLATTVSLSHGNGQSLELHYTAIWFLTHDVNGTY